MTPSQVLHTEFLVSVSGIRRKDIKHGAAAVATETPKLHSQVNLTQVGSLLVGDVSKFVLIQSNTRFKLKFLAGDTQVNLICERLFIAYTAMAGVVVEPDSNVMTYVDVIFD